MKPTKVLKLIAVLSFFLVMTSTSALSQQRSQTLYFKNGKQINCDQVWQEGDNLFVVPHGKRFAISYEKKVEPGFVDVYGMDRDGRLVVVELKRRTAGRDAALQLAKYVDCIKTVAKKELRGVLVAPRLAKGVKTLLTSLGLEFKALEPKKCAEVLRRSETRKLADFFE